jgi:ABC-type lipoprotein export system ATPase subunit
MQLRTFVWREMFERRNQLATSLLAILLGIAAIVSIKNVTFYSEKAVAGQLEDLSREGRTLVMVTHDPQASEEQGALEPRRGSSCG